MLARYQCLARSRDSVPFPPPKMPAAPLSCAMQAQDDQAPLRILGPAGKDVLSSGDPAEDADARVGFVVKYEAMHRFVTEADGAVTLVVGAENWPFPIPLVNKNGAWYFDTPAGRDEIVFRRIGKNELARYGFIARVGRSAKTILCAPAG